jgi:hypothetical protein
LITVESKWGVRVELMLVAMQLSPDVALVVAVVIIGYVVWALFR